MLQSCLPGAQGRTVCLFAVRPLPSFPCSFPASPYLLFQETTFLRVLTLWLAIALIWPMEASGRLAWGEREKPWYFPPSLSSSGGVFGYSFFSSVGRASARWCEILGPMNPLCPLSFSNFQLLLLCLASLLFHHLCIEFLLLNSLQNTQIGFCFSY